MPNFEDLVLRDTRANQPAAGIAGRIYFVTDEEVLERDSGSVWQGISVTGSASGGVARSGATVDNHVAVWNGSNADSLKDGGALETRVLLATSSPTGTTVTFNSIPGGYRRLIVKFVARSDKAAVANESLSVYLNNDTTAANYRRQRGTFSGGTATIAGNDDSNLVVIPAANAGAGSAGYGTIVIEGYADTTFNKQTRADFAYRDGATNEVLNLFASEWESTVAVTRLDIITASSGNFVAGSRFDLYGEG